jgi:DNA-binding response OmpR family regulator
MLRRIFLVDPDPQGAAKLARSLVNEHYSVSVVSSFEEVCALAASGRPDLLITSVRLGRFNGLHLAARFRADYPGLPMIVLGDDDELALAADAMQLQARFVPKSTPCPDFLRYVDELISGRNPKDLVSTRRWPRLGCEFPAHLAEANGHGHGFVRDVGYGGLRLECETQPETRTPMEIRLGTVGMNLMGICRWSTRVDDRTWTCGFELDTSATDARQWRRIVDSLVS